MKDKRGLTLVEIIVSIAILGIIAAAFLPTMSVSFLNLFQTRHLTEAVFVAQEQVEQEMETARNTDTTASDPAITVFGKVVYGHPIHWDIVSDTGTTRGEINVFVPKHVVTYNVPQIAGALLRVFRSDIEVANPHFFFPLDDDVEMLGTYTNGSQQDFLLNVYRWYMSPVSIDQPSNFREWIIVKEWNEARAPLSYADSDDFTLIPNIEENYDSLDLYRDFGFTNDEIAERFAGRYFVYSITPYSKIGRVGEEVFSNVVNANKIVAIDPIYISLEGRITTTTYAIGTTVPARMLDNSTLDLPVTWDDSSDIDLTTMTGEVVRHGTVEGYPDQVEFHLSLNNIYIPTSVTIAGIDRAVIPTSGTRTYSFSASVLDQHGNPMQDEIIEWDLLNEGSGISIDSNGILQVPYNAVGADEFQVKALVQNSSINSQKTVRTAKATAGNCSGTTTTTTQDTSYRIVVKDDQGIGITGLTMSDIYVNRVYQNSSTYVSLTATDARSTINVVSFTDAGEGVYTFIVHQTSSSGVKTVNTGGVRVYYNTTNVQIASNLSVRYK